MKNLLFSMTLLASVSSFASDCGKLEGVYKCKEISSNTNIVYVVGDKVEISSSQSLFEVKNLKEDSSDTVLYKVFPDGIERTHEGYSNLEQVVNGDNYGELQTTCKNKNGKASLEITVKDGFKLWYQDKTVVKFEQLNADEIMIEKTSKESGVMKNTCFGVHCSKANDEKTTVKCTRI